VRERTNEQRMVRKRLACICDGRDGNHQSGETEAPHRAGADSSEAGAGGGRWGGAWRRGEGGGRGRGERGEGGGGGGAGEGVAGGRGRGGGGGRGGGEGGTASTLSLVVGLRQARLRRCCRCRRAENHIGSSTHQYEGQECSKNIFLHGAVPNQRLSLRFCVADGHLRRVPKTAQKVYLVGRLRLPRTANTIIKEQMKALCLRW